MNRASQSLSFLVGFTLLVGCSQPQAQREETSSPRLYLAASAKASEEAGTVRMKGTFISRGPSAPAWGAPSSDIMIVHTGTWDFKNRRGEWVYDPRDFQPPPRETEVSRVFYEEDAFYNPVPPDRVKAAGGKHWLRMERGKFGQQNPLGIGGVTSPSDVLDSLPKVAEDIRKVGKEKVRGVKCVRYTMKVSLLTLLEGLDGKEHEESGDNSAWGKAIVPLDVWIGKDDDLLRKSLIDMSMGERGFVSTTELELFDYGVKAEFEMPPASDTYTPRDLDDYNRVMGYES